ncbi:alpha/beta fold hydrolase BchO [Sulfitobacter sp. LCG007]
MDWERHLPRWPLAGLSRQVTVAPHRWHVQECSEGETLLLIHGAGASTHSWRDMIPLLAVGHHVVALDLPGQGFTRVGARGRYGLEETAEDLETLCIDRGWSPVALVGHSAGAAVALRLADRLSGRIGQTPKVVGINPALSQFEGPAGRLYPLFARVLAATPLAAAFFSFGNGNIAKARSLIGNTGSQLNDEGLELYARLISDRDHVDGTLKMMAHWSLDRLLSDLPDLAVDCLFITGAQDRAVPPDAIEDLAGRMQSARVVRLPRLGHLLHEEQPERTARLVLDFVDGARAQDASAREGS